MYEKSDVLVCLQSHTRTWHRHQCVIPVQVYNNITVSLLQNFSKTSNGFYSNSHWKCSNVEEPGWFTNRFDDRHWSYGLVIRGDEYTSDEFRDEWPLTAQFIGTRDTQDTDIYCRGRLCHGEITECCHQANKCREKSLLPLASGVLLTTFPARGGRENSFYS